jgi:hypothetical protein
MDADDEIRAAAEKELQALALEGVNSGEPIRPDASYWEEMHQQLDERLKREPRTSVELPEQIDIRPGIMGGKPCLKAPVSRSISSSKSSGQRRRPTKFSLRTRSSQKTTSR